MESEIRLQISQGLLTSHQILDTVTGRETCYSEGVMQHIGDGDDDDDDDDIARACTSGRTRLHFH